MGNKERNALNLDPEDDFAWVSDGLQQTELLQLTRALINHLKKSIIAQKHTDSLALEESGKKKELSHTQVSPNGLYAIAAYLTGHRERVPLHALNVVWSLTKLSKHEKALELLPLDLQAFAAKQLLGKKDWQSIDYRKLYDLVVAKKFESDFFTISQQEKKFRDEDSEIEEVIDAPKEEKKSRGRPRKEKNATS